MKTGARSRSAWFKLRVLPLTFVMAGVCLTLLATASPQKLTHAGGHNVDVQPRRPDEIKSAPSDGSQEAWVARYNGTGNLDDVADAVVVDNSGNVYVAGASEGSSSGSDYMTIKYDSAGQQQWVARYDGTAHDFDEADAIALDKAGNVYVTGFSFGSGGYFRYVTIKYNSAGQRQWIAPYNGIGNGNDFAVAIAVDASDNIYVTGQSFDSPFASDYVTIKYNSAGQEQWVARYNDFGGELNGATAIAVDAAGNVYVTGESDYDYATIKYDPAGQEQWVARYNGPGPVGNSADGASAIAIDNSGNIYVTGFSVSSGGDYDYATIKYNSAGQEQWVSRYNGPGNDWDLASDIALDRSGNVYVTGQSVGTTYPDYDYATIKYDSAGQEQWIARYNGPGNGEDDAVGVVLDSAGNAYVTGASEGSRGAFDYATIKYNPSGDQQWVVRYEGPANSYDLARAIAVDGSDNVYVSGNSVGLGTGSDYATIKYVQDAIPTPTPTATPTPITPPRPLPTPRLHPIPTARP